MDETQILAVALNFLEQTGMMPYVKAALIALLAISIVLVLFRRGN